jgi:hypothetical protein
MGDVGQDLAKPRSSQDEGVVEKEACKIFYIFLLDLPA